MLTTGGHNIGYGKCVSPQKCDNDMQMVRQWGVIVHMIVCGKFKLGWVWDKCEFSKVHNLDKVKCT